jgi:hypothetical protein
VDLRPAPHASIDLPPPGKLFPSPSSLHLFVVEKDLPHPSYIGATTVSTTEGIGGGSSVWPKLQLLMTATMAVAGSSARAWIWAWWRQSSVGRDLGLTGLDSGSAAFLFLKIVFSYRSA